MARRILPRLRIVACLNCPNLGFPPSPPAIHADSQHGQSGWPCGPAHVLWAGPSEAEGLAMRWSRSIFELLSLGLMVATVGCAGTATKRQAVEPFGAYRGPANPTRDGWSEPTLVSSTEGQRLSRYFPGLSGRNRVSTASNANLAGVQASQTTNPAPRRVSMPAEVPARSESARVSPSSSSPRPPTSDLPPPFLPTAMTVPSARVPRPDLVADVEAPQNHQVKPNHPEVVEPLATPPLPEVNPVTELITQGDLPPRVPGSPALTDIETKPTNLEQPAKPTSPPLPEVNPATSLAARTVVPPTEPVVPPPVRVQPRPELDVEDLAPRIAAANRSDENESSADVDSVVAPRLPSVDPLAPALNAQPVAPTPAYAPQPAMFAQQPAQASTTIVRPRWVPFRRESAVFNKPIQTTPYREPRSWEFWNQAPTNAPAQAIPKPVPSQPKGWFGTNFQPRIRLWSTGTDN